MSIGEEVIKRLKEAFPDVRLKLTDTTGSDDHWDLHIASEALQGLSKVKQHQAIYKPIRDLIDSNKVHALKISVFAPSAWQD